MALTLDKGKQNWRNCINDGIVDASVGRNMQPLKSKCTTKLNCGGLSKVGRTLLVLCEISALRNLRTFYPWITTVVLV